jgi:hypothetical protein
MQAESGHNNIKEISLQKANLFCPKFHDSALHYFLLYITLICLEIIIIILML